MLCYCRKSTCSFLKGIFVLLLWIANICDAQDCFEQQYANYEADFGSTHIIQRISIIAPLTAYYLSYKISDDHESHLYKENGQRQIIYSSLSSNNLEWHPLNLLAKAIRIVPILDGGVQGVSPVIILTVCKYSSRPLYFDAEPFSIDTYKAGLVSMYENELLVTFRTFENGIFFFSLADQGDMLIVQLVRGRVEAIFDFGSLSRSTITGGKALNDGEWHELKWVHQFDSVLLYIDGILVNSTIPSGLYRKLDFNFQIEIGGRPEDQYSSDIETSYHGCFARFSLNKFDLLAYAPTTTRDCQMPRPQTLTIKSGSVQIPYSFLPFSVEFRLLFKPTTLLSIHDTTNETLLELLVDANQTLLLEAEDKQVKQLALTSIRITDGSWHALSLKIRGGRLDVDVDGMTVLWLEGSLVRKIGLKMSAFRISAAGCYRSATVDLKSAQVLSGQVLKNKCAFMEKCMPNLCENGGTCVQTDLDEFHCECPTNFSGTYCHTSLLPHSCEDYRFVHHRSPKRSQTVVIDLDGGGPLRPVTVNCTIPPTNASLEDAEEFTILSHNVPKGVHVTGDTEPGAIRRNLNYTVDGEELDRFVEGFENCRQYMRFECAGGTKLMNYNNERRPSSWYATRNGQHGLQWADAPPYSRMCSCALNSSCSHNRMLCNCDSGRDGVDEGYNSHPQLLPIMQLFIGGTAHKASANVTIGPLECSRRMVYEMITFIDRNQHLIGSQTFSGNVFDIYFQARFSHTQMTIFTWESPNGERWFQLFIREGRVVGQIVNAGRSSEIVSDYPINDNEWHIIYWEADPQSMKLVIDRKEKSILSFYILPSTFTYIIGSRSGRGNAGFAGQLRSMYLNGKEVVLGQMVRKATPLGVQIGDTGYCHINRCYNNGKCVELYDTYKCNCSNTPFSGDKCEQAKNYGYVCTTHCNFYNFRIIPWQHPAQIDTCYRISIHTLSSNISLIRAKALFADSTFNLSITEEGLLNVKIYDGFFFHHNLTYTKQKINDDKMKDIAFCASKVDFKLTINEEPALELEANFTFFINLNVWNFIDKNFTGCISRLRIGSAFPLKNPTESRLSYSGKIKFGSCPYDQLQYSKPIEVEDRSSDITISSIVKSQQRLMLITPAIGVLTALLLAFALCIFVCYVRSRPDGVYKTNENVVAYCSPSKSAEPLVEPVFTKEYFC